MRLRAALTFSDVVCRLLIVFCTRFWMAPSEARCVLIDCRAASMTSIAALAPVCVPTLIEATDDSALAFAVVAVKRPPADALVTEKASDDVNFSVPPTVEESVVAVAPVRTTAAPAVALVKALRPCRLMLPAPVKSLIEMSAPVSDFSVTEPPLTVAVMPVVAA